MKKILFTLLAVVLFASCEDKTNYTIEVTVKDATENTKVVMYEDRRGQKELETAVAENGKFIFKGKADDSVIRFIGIEGKQMQLLEIVLEPGKIIINTDENDSVGVFATVSGTPLNEKNYAFWSSLGTKTAPDSELVNGYIKANADNILGVYYLNRNAYNYDLDQLKEILAGFSPKFDNNEMLNNIRENVKAQEETAVGKKFKDLKSLSPEGSEIALSDYAGKGKIVLVDFWASWCPPCRADMPHLVEAYAKYKDKGFEIVGVSLDKTKEDWIKGIADLNITWPQMSDVKFWDSELAKVYAVRSIPSTVLIDGEGNIIAKKIGGKELDAKLEELLK